MSWKSLARRDPRSGRFLLVFIPCRTLGVMVKLHRVVRARRLGLKEGKFPIIPSGFLLKFGICLADCSEHWLRQILLSARRVHGVAGKKKKDFKKAQTKSPNL